MDPEKQKELLRIKEQTRCSKQHRCLKDSLRDICKAKYLAVADMMQCLDETPEKCDYSQPSEGIIRCKCPLRRYIAIHIEEIS